jgi:hypothetical protein
MMMNHSSTTIEEYVEELARFLVELRVQVHLPLPYRSKPFINGSVNSHLIFFTLVFFSFFYFEVSGADFWWV